MSFMYFNAYIAELKISKSQNSIACMYGIHFDNNTQTILYVAFKQ